MDGSRDSGGALLEGKVAIVTGAGRGVGRDVALLLASQGASVLVNDLGGAANGGGNDAGPASSVVAEIEAAGGQAISNVTSITEFVSAEAMVAEAMERFGRLDIVVNNAGILRDAIFHKMSEEDWDAVLAVHLKGSFNLARAAAPVFRAQHAGRMIHMTSNSGLIGNYGQANYIAAKLGIVGLSRAIALDMARFNVTSNVIGPQAWSRLIGVIPTETEEEKARVERFKRMTPAKVANLVVALAAPDAQHITGQIFVCRGNEIHLMSQPRPVRSLARPDGWTPETILSNAFPAMQGSLTPLERSNDVFGWEPA
ncbi:MAG: SDR family NAD(P)-dependent oxidoreductase [Pseudomonadota bacterium]